MIEAVSPAQRAIDSARALLKTLITNGWKEVHVTSAEGEFFIASEEGRPNPMTHPDYVSASEREPAAAPIVITAPHIATILFLGDVGRRCGSGMPMAKLRVLDETIDIDALSSGRITACHVELGALVEFGTPLISFLEDPR